MGGVRAGSSSPAVGTAGAGSGAEPAPTGRTGAAVRAVPAGQATSAGCLGLAVAAVAGLEVARRPGAGSRDPRAPVAAGRDPAGRGRLHRRPGSDRHRTGVPCHPGRRPRRRSGWLRASALQPASRRNALAAAVRRSLPAAGLIGVVNGIPSEFAVPPMVAGEGCARLLDTATLWPNASPPASPALTVAP